MKIRKIVEGITDTLSQDPLKYNYDKEESGYGYHKYSFDTENASYEVEISGVDCEKGENCRMNSLSFHEITRGQNIIGTGNAGKVFTTVLDITRDFLRKNPNEILFFSSGDGDRTRDLLYRRFVKEVKKFFPGYVGITTDFEGDNMFIVPKSKLDDELKEYIKGITFLKNRSKLNFF